MPNSAVARVVEAVEPPRLGRSRARGRPPRARRSASGRPARTAGSGPPARRRRPGLRGGGRSAGRSGRGVRRWRSAVIGRRAGGGRGSGSSPPRIDGPLVARRQEARAVGGRAALDPAGRGRAGRRTRAGPGSRSPGRSRPSSPGSACPSGSSRCSSGRRPAGGSRCRPSTTGSRPGRRRSSAMCGQEVGDLDAALAVLAERPLRGQERVAARPSGGSRPGRSSRARAGRPRRWRSGLGSNVSRWLGPPCMNR